jgi:hypothetical protein
MTRDRLHALGAFAVSLVAATVAMTTLVVVSPQFASPAEASTRRCETTSHGRVCATMHKPSSKSQLGREARRLNTWKRLPIAAGTKGTYRGYARRNLTNGRDVVAIRSKVNRRVWQTFTVRRPSACKPFERADADGSASIVYPNLTPRCEGHVWVIRTSGHVPEDAYGWNCYLDGNGDCGTAGASDADGCVTFSTDHYTMCPDGRAYLKQGLRHAAEIVRR